MGIGEIISLVMLIVKYAPELVGLLRKIAEAIKTAREGQALPAFA